MSKSLEFTIGKELENVQSPIKNFYFIVKFFLSGFGAASSGRDP